VGLNGGCGGFVGPDERKLWGSPDLWLAAGNEKELMGKNLRPMQMLVEVTFTLKDVGTEIYILKLYRF